MSDDSRKPRARTIERRSFLTLIPKAFAGAGLFSLIESASSAFAQSPVYPTRTTNEPVCWLDVCAPFIVEDPEIGLHSEIVLTSDTFAGARGHEDGADATEYEIHIYDAQGRAVGPDGIAKRLVIPAMQLTALSLREIVGDKPFWGGMRIRLRPKGRAPMHASDLFSSAFVRWTTVASFDSVHANPDPLQWQRPDAFFYSMPFPSLDAYDCIFSLFNPNEAVSTGVIALHSDVGEKLKHVPYKLTPRSSLLLDLRKGEMVDDPRSAFYGTSDTFKSKSATSKCGTIAVTNQQGSVKSFGYLLMKRIGAPSFTVEHPIHQPPFKPVVAPAPFDAEMRFKPRNILYTPLVFRSKRIGGLTLESRFYFSSGAPLEEFFWLKPFITDGRGNIAWQVTRESPLPASISPKQVERGAVKLAGLQSCLFDPAQIRLPKDFSGGMFLAIAPTSNHTLMKVEVRVNEWNAHAFTHFRPGLQAARSYQSASYREGLATDYIASGARLERAAGKITRDEIISVINIDDRGTVGHPTLEVFCSGGLVARIALGEVPNFACRHYLISELQSERIPPLDLSFRLVDERATQLMSVVHLDYSRHDLALDHGSDRFSTFIDYPCEPAK